MNTEIINSMLAAATDLHNTIESAKMGDFGPFWLPWSYGGISSRLEALAALDGLKNEFEGNVLAAPDTERVKALYKPKIAKIKALCPYEQCGGGYTYEPATDKSPCVLDWPIERARALGKLDESGEVEMHVKAHYCQDTFAKHVAALCAWWSEIEPAPELHFLGRSPDLNTDRARKYFARAIERGYMVETSTGYRWQRPKDRGRRAALGYFIKCVYRGYIPERELCALFDEKRLGQAARSSQTPLAIQMDKEIFGDE